MRILVYGAGVLGSLYAARLQRSGQSVTLLARGQRLAELRERGIELEDAATGERTSTQVNVVEELWPADAYDLVMVLMRRNQVASVLPALAANHATPNVLFMTNNAAGAAEYVAALGKERVLLGFPAAGGVRRDGVVRFMLGRQTVIGEPDGRLTARLEEIAAALEGAGFAAGIRTDMEAWLKTHVAVVSPVANAIYAAGGDIYRLARTRDALVLMVRAVREGLRVLEALDIPVAPASLKALMWVPEPLLIAVLERRLASPDAELGLAGHANAARDEMTWLADEFYGLVRQAGVLTPAIDQLRVYLDPAEAPLPDGSRSLPLDRRSVAGGAALLAVVVLLVAGLRKKHRA